MIISIIQEQEWVGKEVTLKFIKIDSLLISYNYLFNEQIES